MDATKNPITEEQHWRVVFDALPLPAFVVNADVRIQDCNLAAVQQLGIEPKNVLHQRGGDALHCLEAPKQGCGKGPACADCIIRDTVNHAIAGQKTYRQAHKWNIWKDGQTVSLDLLVSATPVPDTTEPQVLLLLEDVSELLALRNLLPVCAYCKRVRDDQQYWESIDTYLHKHMHMKISHGICPACLAEQKKKLLAAARDAAPPTQNPS